MAPRGEATRKNASSEREAPSNARSANKTSSEATAQPTNTKKPQPTISKKPMTQLPVTVLSGFLGSGKTTLLKHILRTADSETNPMRIAVIVNDMGEINLDASEIKFSKLIQEDATMVEMTNGCICCTLRGDLLKTVKALSEEQAFDYLVIESTGIAEPLPVAQTFVMDVDGEGDEANQDIGAGKKTAAARRTKKEKEQTQKQSLSHFARLDTLVTVVDALNIFDVLSSLETLAEENSAKMVGNTGLAEKTDSKDDGDDLEQNSADDRSIAQLWLDQIEFANVIVLSKAHMLGAQAASESATNNEERDSGRRNRKKQMISLKHRDAHTISKKSNEAAVQELEALLRRLNPKARIIVPKQSKFADVQIGDLVCTALFDMEEAQESAGWKLELQKEVDGVGHTPETEEYGVGSVVFRSRERPFHPGRLHTILQGFGNYKSAAARRAAGPVDKKAKKNDNDGVFNGLVRAKGLMWIASANAYPVDFHAAGRVVELDPRSIPYLAAVPPEEWDEDDEEQYNDLMCSGEWHDTSGDRATLVVLIGVHLDKSAMLRALEKALLTDAEFAGGVELWRKWDDPFFGGEFLELGTEQEEDKTEEDDAEEEDDEPPRDKKAAEKKEAETGKRKAVPTGKSAKKARKEDKPTVAPKRGSKNGKRG